MKAIEKVGEPSGNLVDLATFYKNTNQPITTYFKNVCGVYGGCFAVPVLSRDTKKQQWVDLDSFQRGNFKLDVNEIKNLYYKPV